MLFKVFDLQSLSQVLLLLGFLSGLQVSSWHLKQNVPRRCHLGLQGSCGTCWPKIPLLGRGITSGMCFLAQTVWVEKESEVDSSHDDSLNRRQFHGSEIFQMNRLVSALIYSFICIWYKYSWNKYTNKECLVKVNGGTGILKKVLEAAVKLRVVTYLFLAGGWHDNGELRS